MANSPTPGLEVSGSTLTELSRAPFLKAIVSIKGIKALNSPAGVAAAHAAGMVPVGFIGGTHTGPNLGAYLTNAGARAVIADMRALKSTVVALRGF